MPTTALFAALLLQVVHPDQLTGNGAKVEPRPPRPVLEIGVPPSEVTTKSGKTIQNGLRTADYEYVLGKGVTTKEVVYFSEGVGCYAKIFYPPGFDPARKPGVPAVVLGQGYAGNHMSIEKYGSRFAEKGLVAMVIDYRGWGFSDGVPERVTPRVGGGAERDNTRFTVETVKVRFKRTDIIPQDQQTDYRNAISYIQGEPGVDYQRIGVWGSSLAGGNATVVAGRDGRVKAVSVQVPAIAAPTDIRSRLKLNSWARADAIKRAREGQGKEYVTGFSRYFAVDQFRQFQALQENDVGFWSTKITVPYQAVAAADDQLIPVAGVRAAVDRVPGTHNLVVVPGITHFEMYSHQAFEISADAAADWFVKYLNAPEAADPPEAATPEPPVYPPNMQKAPAHSGRRGAAKGAIGN